MTRTIRVMAHPNLERRMSLSEFVTLTLALEQYLRAMEQMPEISDPDKRVIEEGRSLLAWLNLAWANSAGNVFLRWIQ